MRRDLGFVLVQVLCVGVALPVLSAFTTAGWPPQLRSRWAHAQAPASNLGFEWLPDAITPGMRQASGFGDLMSLLLALGLVVLLVGCATQGTLVLRRGWEQREELSTHTALGATRADLRRLVLGNWLRLLAIGTALGVGLGLGLDAWLRALAPEVIVPPPTRFSALSLLAVLGPALAVFGSASIEAGRAIQRMRAPLGVSPVARLFQLGVGAVYLGALFALLSTAAVLLRGSVTTGSPSQEWKEARDTLVIDIEPAAPGVLAEALERLNDPGSPSRLGPWHAVSAGAFEDLGVAQEFLFDCRCLPSLIGRRPGGRQGGSGGIYRVRAQHHSVSPGVFEAFGVPLLDGREFDLGDHSEAPLVAVVDQSFMDQFLDADPVGKLIRIGPRERGTTGTWYTIVGLVDVPESGGLANADMPIGGIYFSSLQHPPQVAQLLVSDPSPENGVAIATLASIAPGLSIGTVVPLAGRLAAWEAPMRWFAAFAALLGLVVAGIGVLGLGSSIALDVRARIRELGVHRAIGARRADVRRVVLADVARVVTWGAVLGLVTGPAVVRGLSHRFAALDPLDVATSTQILAVLILASLAGAAGPLRRASRITPIEAMGSES